MTDNEWPTIWLLFATYKRTEAALSTIASLRKYLVYPNVHYHICDDGSGKTDDGTDREHVQVLKSAIAEFSPDVTAHTMNTPPGAFNTGGNINVGIKLAKEAGSDIHILIFDDWALMRELDIRPMVDVLTKYNEVGFIRLSYTVPGMAGVCTRYDDRRGGWMWLRLIRDWTLRNQWVTDSYMVSTQPYIAHARFFDYYGMHPENCSPGEAETGLGGQYNRHNNEDGPQILFSIGRCTTHAPWEHSVGRAHSYAALFGQA